jgi:signal transduction histidine kinase
MKKTIAWHAPFKYIRIRLLVWYFLLAAGTTVSALLVTRHLYCDRLDEKAEASLEKEVERFKRAAIQLPEDGASRLVDRFLADYVLTQGEMIITFIDGQLYRASHPLPDWLQRNPALMEQWSNLSAPQRQKIASPDRRLFYIAEPLTTQEGIQSTFVVLRDSTDAYRSGTEAIELVMMVSMAVLGGFSIIAWTTTGRILKPLHLMNQAARKITESDMTQRIVIEGDNEIIAVATTFNAMLDRLQLAFDSQQEFLKDVSHELRTPITIIQGQLEILPYRPEKQPETIALITSELARMNRLVNDLLLLTKAERPDFLYLKSEDLDWLTEEIYLKARSFSSERNWQLEAKGLYPVLLDKQRFSQAVMNLIQNAVHHTQPGDTIAIGSIVTNNTLRFWVRDTGQGIAAKNQVRIFERFAQVSNSNRQFEGAGLGLSIVSAIVQAHGGHIELESELGKGTIFTLIIPLTSTAELSETARHEPHSNRRGQSTYSRLSECWPEGARVQHSDR